MEDIKNVITIQPRVGDIVCRDADGNISYIEQDTFSQADFPQTWETVGVVVIRKGNRVTIISKNNETKKYMEVYPYVVTGYTLDGTEHTAQLRLHGKPTTSTYYDFAYTASDVDGFVAALQQLLAANGETDWSAYKDEDGSVVLQYDNYNSAEYYSASYTYASGLTLTEKVTVDFPEQMPSCWRLCGNRGYPVWSIERAKEYFRSDNLIVSYNPASDVTSVPIYPICWPAFAGTSQYQDDHCLWLRQQYCTDPAHPTEEEWETYIGSLVAYSPYMIGGNAPRWRDGKSISDTVKNVTYLAADGTRKKLYQGIAYCSEFMDGMGYMPAPYEFVEAFRGITYGLSGVTREESDRINRILYAIGGDSVASNISWWVPSRFKTDAAWCAYFTGYVDGRLFCYSYGCVPFALLELPSGND